MLFSQDIYGKKRRRRRRREASNEEDSSSFCGLPLRALESIFAHFQTEKVEVAVLGDPPCASYVAMKKIPGSKKKKKNKTLFLFQGTPAPCPAD